MHYTPYTLYPVGALSARAAAQPREGVLLRGDNGGYACLQAWPELGDAPLEYELDALREGTPLRLGERALKCMELDGEARAKGVSLFEGLRVPRSHATLTVSATPSQVYCLHQKGFRVGKIKVIPKIASTVERLVNLAAMVPDWKWRVDFNCTLSPEAALKFWDTLSDAMKERIDFIEDPCAYDVNVWQKLQDAGMPLGYDMPVAEGSSIPTRTSKPMMRIVKPAHHHSNTGKPIFTSYMDHPLGQCWAAYNAALYYTDKPESEVPLCGLVTQHIFKPNAFSEELGMDVTPEFRIPSGTGLGFDKLLAALPWKKL
ncbi:MAG: enolase C-terminal domain-like protein [Akkermansia sp.]